MLMRRKEKTSGIGALNILLDIVLFVPLLITLSLTSVSFR